MKSLKNLLISGMILWASCMPMKTVSAHDTIKKLVSEITYTEKNNILKLRPFDYMLPSETQRTDLLIGRKFKDLSLYGYWMFDNKGRTWIGTRLDYGKKALNGKLRANVQLRYLFGMNEKTKNKIYFIPTVDYKIGNFNIGILGYGVKSSGEDLLFYAGPLLSTKLTENISTTISLSKSPLDNSNLVYWKTDFKFGKN